MKARAANARAVGAPHAKSCDVMFVPCQVMGMKAGNLRANMFIYKSIGDKATDSAVVMEDDGDVGTEFSMDHIVVVTACRLI